MTQFESKTGFNVLVRKLNLILLLSLLHGALHEGQLQQRHDGQRRQVRQDGFHALSARYLRKRLITGRYLTILLNHLEQVVLPESENGGSKQRKDLHRVVGRDQVPEE